MRHPGPWPRCGAGVAIFRGGDVLLVERGAGALKGLWSLPGGHIEPGERAQAAALLEAVEETGVEAEITGLVDIHEVILHGDEDELTAHYLIAVFCGRWLAGEPVPAGDAAGARFMPINDVGTGRCPPLTEGAAALINRAWSDLQCLDRKP
jgi:8-oxo-dGTP diphosphatase